MENKWLCVSRSFWHKLHQDRDRQFQGQLHRVEAWMGNLPNSKFDSFRAIDLPNSFEKVLCVRRLNCKEKATEGVCCEYPTIIKFQNPWVRGLCQYNKRNEVWERGPFENFLFFEVSPEIRRPITIILIPYICNGGLFGFSNGIHTDWKKSNRGGCHQTTCRTRMKCRHHFLAYKGY